MKNVINLRGSLVALLSGLLLTAAGGASAQIQFDDVSMEAGMTGFTESWGASWGDVNADNWPDLFNQGHRDYPRFYRNTGDGSFQDIAYEADPDGYWIADPFDDKHGASFADYDNDGDDDLLIGVSATGPAIFMVNDNPGFTNRANESDLSNDASARLPVWFDYDDDGHLDVAQMHFSGTYMRRRDPDDNGNPLYDFDGVAGTTGFSCPNKQLNYGQQIDLDGDGSLEVMCLTEGPFPYRAYDISTLPFTNVTSSVPSVNLANNSIVADFNNDLLTDIVVTRGTLRPSGAALASPFRIESWLRKDDSQPSGKGFYFESDGEITVAIDHRGMGLYDNSKIYVLSPTGQTVGDAGPVSVRWLEDEGRWYARLDTGGTTQAYLQIDTVEPITNLVETQLDNPEFAIEPYHLVNSPTGLSANYSTGLYVPMYCSGIAAADFDNDMDIDVYFACRRGAENLPNRLFENQGDGTFIERVGFGGEGPAGVGFAFGTADSAVLADYDVDGFMDIYVANGLLYYPIGEGGPDSLLRNTTDNGNHWIEIDLVGTTSNRDGVGAKVTVTADGVTQLREQNGGYHRWSQNHQRLHFGLGPNETADVTIEWPSGVVDNFTAIAADALYDATEGGAMTPAVLGPPVFTELQAGDECGEPPYDFDYGPAVLLWKDCGTGVWSLRAKGGRVKTFKQITAGEIVADAPFSETAEFSLVGSDFLDNSIPSNLNFSVGTWYANDRGFDFSTAGQTQSCFDLTTQEIPTFIVGASRKQIQPPFDLVTLGACAAPPEFPPECGDPLVSGPDDPGVYVWKDCGYQGPDARWNVTMGGGSLAWGAYAGDIYSDVILSAAGDQLEPNDELDTEPGDAQIDFVLYVGGSGIDGFQTDIPAGAEACLVPEFFSAGAGNFFLGADRQPIAGNLNMADPAASCEPPAPPEDPPGCGDPNFDSTTENGVFLWRNCNLPGNDQRWQLRVAAGGTPWGPYEGTLESATATLAPIGFSLEGNDVLDSVPGDGLVDFELKVGGSGVDGFTVDIPSDANACFDVSSVQNGAQVFFGQDREVLSGSINLTTFEACN